MNKSILFLLPYPLHRAPSQRFRVEAFFPLLNEQGIGFRTHCFFDEQAWQNLYQKGSLLQKAGSVVRGFLSRLWVVLFVAPQYDYVFIHREAAPIGPPIFEWLLCCLLNKKLVYDFDDAIWIPAVSEHNKLASSLKCSWKVRHICRWAYQVAAGNDYLALFARQRNAAVALLPTCVDTATRFNKLQCQQGLKTVIGWTGSHSTLFYLDGIVPVLRRLEAEYDFEFLVICNQPPTFSLKQLRYVPWQEATEIADLLQVDIGVMPLVQDDWSNGKCGFKVIQYLSLGIPAVASPIGVNNAIVNHEVNGYLCADPEEWYAALATLLQNASLRKRMGASGRRKIEASYSIQVHSATFLSLFDRKAANPETKQPGASKAAVPSS